MNAVLYTTTGCRAILLDILREQSATVDSVSLFDMCLAKSIQPLSHDLLRDALIAMFGVVQHALYWDLKDLGGLNRRNRRCRHVREPHVETRKRHRLHRLGEQRFRHGSRGLRHTHQWTEMGGCQSVYNFLFVTSILQVLRTEQSTLRFSKLISHIWREF